VQIQNRNSVITHLSTVTVFVYFEFINLLHCFLGGGNINTANQPIIDSLVLWILLVSLPGLPAMQTCILLMLLLFLFDGTNYFGMHWVNLHQIFMNGRHVDRDDQFDIHFVITQGILLC